MGARLRQLSTGAFSVKRLARGTPGRLSRSIGPLTLPQLVIADLAPPPTSGPADNLVLAVSKDKDMVFTIPFPVDEEPTIGDSGVLKLNGVVLEATRVKFTADGQDLVLTLPKDAHATDGRYDITYELYFVFNNNTERGPDSFFTIDYSEPGLPDLAAPAFTFDVDSGLRPEVLEADGSLKAHVFGYNGLALDDAIIGMIEGIGEAPIGTVDHIPGQGDAISVVWPDTLIAQLKDGDNVFSYRIEDRAGNKSPESTSVTIPTLLAGNIKDLAAPEVPANDSDNLIVDDEARTAAGVVVLIPAHAKLDENYTFIVHWGGSESDETPFAPGHPTPAASIGIPYGTVYDGWFATSAGADVSVPVEVYYEVFRGGIAAGTSPKKTVNVNLNLAGGKDPDPETPVHENLKPLTIRSASNDNNLIKRDDFGKPATAIIPYQTNESTPTKVFLEKDVIVVVHGTRAATHKVTAAEAAADADISFELAAGVITGAGAGTFQTSYVIHRATAGGPPSMARAPAQTVVVESRAELPGGGDPLPPATWVTDPANPPPDLQTIGPHSAINGTIFEIPFYTNKKAGDRITVNIIIAPAFSHVDGEVPVPNRQIAPVEITVSADANTSTRTPAYPYRAFMKEFGVAPRSMHMHLTYTVIGAGLEDTEIVNSGELFLRVDCRGDDPYPGSK